LKLIVIDKSFIKYSRWFCYR